MKFTIIGSGGVCCTDKAALSVQCMQRSQSGGCALFQMRLQFIFRGFEHMRLNWFDVSEDKECTNPIDVFAMSHVMEDLNAISTKFGSILDYYEKVRNRIKRKV